MSKQMTPDEYMSISCYPWMEQMQPSDRVIHMVVRLPWVKADLSYQNAPSGNKITTAPGVIGAGVFACHGSRNYAPMLSMRTGGHGGLLIRATQVHVYAV